MKKKRKQKKCQLELIIIEILFYHQFYMSASWLPLDLIAWTIERSICVRPERNDEEKQFTRIDEANGNSTSGTFWIDVAVVVFFTSLADCSFSDKMRLFIFFLLPRFAVRLIEMQSLVDALVDAFFLHMQCNIVFFNRFSWIVQLTNNFLEQKKKKIVSFFRSGCDCQCCCSCCYSVIHFEIEIMKIVSFLIFFYAIFRWKLDGIKLFDSRDMTNEVTTDAD